MASVHPERITTEQLLSVERNVGILYVVLIGCLWSAVYEHVRSLRPCCFFICGVLNNWIAAAMSTLRYLLGNWSRDASGIG